MRRIAHSTVMLTLVATVLMTTGCATTASTDVESGERMGTIDSAPMRKIVALAALGPTACELSP